MAEHCSTASSETSDLKVFEQASAITNTAIARYMAGFDGSAVGSAEVGQCPPIHALLAATGAEDLPDSPEDATDFAGDVQAWLDHSVASAAPLFLDKLWVSAHPIAVMGEYLTAAANCSAHTYAVAPFHAAAEVAVLRKLRELADFPCESPFPPAPSQGTAEEQAPFSPPLGDGVTCPGGSYSNFMAMTLARHLAAPDLAQEGWAAHFAGGGRPLVAFTSQQAHYSIVRAGSVLGLGRVGVVQVACDDRGAMDPAALAAAITTAVEGGKRPFFVSTTAGTTVTGAFDPLDAIADVVDAANAALAGEAGTPPTAADGPGWGQRSHIWLHVDGSWGGGLVTLPRDHPQRSLLQGVGRADSFVVNPHKLLGVTQQCSALLVRSPHILRAACASKADYLFHAHDHAAFDQGDKLLTCGRRPDATKLWLMWRQVTTAGLGRRVAHALDMATMFAQMVARDERYALVVPHSSLNVCFWYLPAKAGVRADIAAAVAGGEAEAAAATRLHGDTLGEGVPALYTAMQAAGTVLINHNPLPSAGLPRFLRVVFNSPKVTPEHLVFVLDEIQRLAILAGVEE